MAEALRLREAIAAAVISGATTPEAALELLRADTAPKGVGLPRQTEFALAAIEIGQRIAATREGRLAAAFFLEAERTLDAVLAQMPDGRAAEKSMLLRKRGLIRGRYLNKGLLAKADFNHAIRLRPEDTSIARQRDVVLGTNGDVARAAND